MNFETPLSGGLLIIGSLLWDEHETRVSLRNDFLIMNKATSVPAPIHYGRKSEKRNTYTMVISSDFKSDKKIGIGSLVPFRNKIVNTTELDHVASSIINAEHKEIKSLNRYNWSWGCLGMVINPIKSNNPNVNQLIEFWSSKFSNGFNPLDYVVTNEQSLISKQGLLFIDWKDEYGDLDFIVLTATKPTNPVPTALILSESFKMDNAYFIGNRNNNIQTYQDDEILNILNKSNEKPINLKPFYNAEIPSDWKVKELSEIVDFLDNKRKPIKDSDRNKMNGEYPYYGASGIIDYVNDYIFDEELILLGEDGANILNRSSPLAFRVSGKIWVNNHAHVLKPKKGYDIGFITEFLESIKYDKYNTGTAQPKLNKEICSGIPLLLPPLPEQKAIASLLSTWDVAIHKTEQIITQKELRKKWLMQQLLTGKKRLKGFEDKWQEVHIRDVAQEVSKRNKNDKQLTVLSCTKYDGLVPSLEYFGRKIFSDDVSTYKIVPKNHFAYATNHIEEGSLGYQNILDEALISPMYTVFKTDESINDDYFYKLLKSHPLVYQYQNRMEGSIDRRGGLRWDSFSIIKIKIPIFQEQTAIAQVLQAADKEITLLRAKADKLREQKKGLMQILLTGKKRLKI